jgi:hypothetical protein
MEGMYHNIYTIKSTFGGGVLLEVEFGHPLYRQHYQQVSDIISGTTYQGNTIT